MSQVSNKTHGTDIETSFPTRLEDSTAISQVSNKTHGTDIETSFPARLEDSTAISQVSNKIHECLPVQAGR